MKQIVLVVILISPLIITGCSSTVRFGSAEKKEIPIAKNKSNDGSSSINDSLSDYTVVDSFEGLASFYGEKYHGRKTSSGEVYDMYGLTAAHPTLPLQTIVLITNLKNDLRVVVRINDRMPDHPERIIDLSVGAAKRLDMINDGVVRVKVDVLEKKIK